MAKRKFQMENQINLFDLLGEVGQKVSKTVVELETVVETVVENIVKPITRTAKEFIGNVFKNKNLENYRAGKNLLPTKPKERFEANVESVKLIKSLIEKQEPATHKEQLVLAQFSGWGGLTEYFKEGKYFDTLKNLLSESELMQANRSLLDAYYTNNNLAKIVWDIVARMGFNNGQNRSILDPSMGTGAFFSVIPECLKDADLYGVELETLPAQISKQLFPNANIRNCGFQTIGLNKKFDLIISNIPFGDHYLYDRRKEVKQAIGSDNSYIHDYFCICQPKSGSFQSLLKVLKNNIPTKISKIE